MQKVKIFVETREDFGELEGTYQKVILEAVTEALERIRRPCEVCIYTRNVYVAVRMKKMPEMAETDFYDKKGNPIKNAEEWRRLYQAAGEHSVMVEVGEHSYTRWLQDQMRIYGETCGKTREN